MADRNFLVVDDDNEDLSLFCEAVTAVSPETMCYSANDGQEAISQLVNNTINKPDLIFLDINMPVMNGWQCLLKLKQDEQLKHIPVIIHTTSSRVEDFEIAKDFGALCFFTKPNDFKTLKKMLEIVVSKMDEDKFDAICKSVYNYLGLKLH